MNYQFIKYLEIYFLNREFCSLVYPSTRLKAISFFCLHLTQLCYGHDGMGAGEIERRINKQYLPLGDVCNNTAFDLED